MEQEEHKNHFPRPFGKTVSPLLLLSAELLLFKFTLYTVKKVNNIPVPSRDVTYKNLSGRE